MPILPRTTFKNFTSPAGAYITLTDKEKSVLVFLLTRGPMSVRKIGNVCMNDTRYNFLSTTRVLWALRSMGLIYSLGIRFSTKGKGNRWGIAPEGEELALEILSNDRDPITQMAKLDRHPRHRFCPKF